MRFTTEQLTRLPSFPAACLQAWVAADKAVMDLRYGRMEREELKFKVRGRRQCSGWGGERQCSGRGACATALAIL